MLWTGFAGLRKTTSGEFLNNLMNLRLCKILDIFWVADYPLASKEGLISMTLGVFGLNHVIMKHCLPEIKRDTFFILLSVDLIIEIPQGSHTQSWNELRWNNFTHDDTSVA
jgi:hypothetical protein